MSEKTGIFYDPIYNFHPGYHREIIVSTNGEFNWIPSKVTNIFEDCVWNEQKAPTEHSLVNIGYFPSADRGLAFSPHILLTAPNQPYFMELESVNWLFADTYHHAAQPVPPWKVRLMEQYMNDGNLRSIFWFSQNALDDFFNRFCQNHEVSLDTQKKVRDISTVVPPSSKAVSRDPKDFTTESNQFIIVAGDNQWERKGIDTIGKIFKKIEKEDSTRNWHLNFVGSKLSIGEKLGISNDRLTDHGVIEPDDLSELLAEKPILLFLSRADTYGTTLVQAINGNAFIIATSGETVFATDEILKDYPNKIIIPNIPTENSLAELDEEQIFELVRDLINHPRRLLHHQSTTFSRTRLATQVTELITTRVIP